MLNDKDRLFDEKGYSFAVTHNLKGDDINDWEGQYKENETFRINKRIDSVVLTHEILSWHKDDAENISIDKLEDMARQYIQQRNPDGMYVAVPHFDKSHYHVHICTSGIEYQTGKSMRLDKKNLRELKQNIQQYQIEKYPELRKSIVHHGIPPKEQALLSEKEYQCSKRTGRATDKDQLFVMLKTCFKQAVSKESFFENIKDVGLATYIRGGKTTGVMYENRKFRLKTLGFTEEILQGLDKSIERQKDLGKMRGRNEKTITRER